MKIGDIVRFMNEVGGGRVTAILSREMVSVETEDGFEIPTYVKNLVVVKVDADRNLLYVKGAVPGPKNGIILVRKG